MRYKLLLCFFLTAFFTRAQFWYWATGSTGSSQNHGVAVCKTPGGQLGVCGRFDGAPVTFGSFTLSNAGLTDIYLVKYDGSGNPLWATSAGGNGSDFATDVDNDKFGNFYVTGRFASTSISFGTQTLTNPSLPNALNDGFLAKYDPSGNLVWLKHYTGTGYESGQAVSVDTLGNIYVTGQYGSNPFVIGSQTLTPTGSVDIFTAKYDNNGNLLWAVKAGGLYGDDAVSISTDDLGNAYITGRCLSPTITAGAVTHTFITGLASQSHYFLIKYDPNGAAQWLRGSNGTGINDGVNVTTDYNGGIYVTGEFSSGFMVLGSYTLPLSGSWSGFIAKYDAGGNVLWAKRPVSNYAFGYGIAANNTGVYVSGVAQFPIIFGSYTLSAPSNSFSPFWLVKFDPNGNETCATVLNNGIGDGTDLETDSNDKVYVTGNFVNTPMVMGSFTLPPGPSNTMFVAKYSCECTVPEFTASSSAPVLCAGQQATLTATGASSYTWNTMAMTSSIVVTPLTTTSYTVNASGSECSAALVITQSVSICTGLADEETAPSGISVYPNPGKGLFKINVTGGPGELLFVLYDITGRKVYEQRLVSKTSDLQLEGFSKGLYHFSVMCNGRKTGAGRLAIE